MEWHHQFMKAYGSYIPLDEFKRIKIPTFFNLLEKIYRDLENESKMRSAMLGMTGKRRLGR